MRFPGFIGPSYTLQSVNVDCQRSVNLFPEVNDLGTGKEREVAALVPTPGKRLLLTLAGGVTRGGFTASNGTMFAVGGNKLYSISSSWVATEIGSLQTSTGPVSIADNGIQVVVVDGQYGYVWTIGTSTFAQITDPNFYAADQVTYQDGYFIFNRKNTGQFFISPINAVTPLDPLDIATAEGSPDNLVGLISSSQNVYLLGSQSTEIFYDSGDAAFPFARMQGAVSDIGCAATFSIAKLQNAVYFLGGDSSGQGIVYRMQGLQAQRISTSPIESVIRKLTTAQIAAARAWVYQDGGHAFYVLNIPGASSTWVYDTSTSLWHERTYLNLWAMERDRADWHCVAYGSHVVGDWQDGRIYALESTALTDAGISIKRLRAAPHFSQGGVFIRHNSFQLDMETGVGLDGTAQGTDPQISLRWSDDGGHSWSNERAVSMGKIGKTRTRVLWRRLGQSRDRVYEVSTSEPVKVVLIGAELGVELGAA